METVHGLIVLCVKVLKMDALPIIRFDAGLRPTKVHANPNTQISCGYIGSCVL
jgi:hypothetical protein